MVATGTQYNLADVIQAQQMLAAKASTTSAPTTAGGKQSIAVVSSMQSPTTPQVRAPAQQPSTSRNLSATRPPHPQGPTTSNASRPNPVASRHAPSVASPVRAAVPQATVNATPGSATAAGGAKAPVTPNKQVRLMESCETMLAITIE